MNVNNIAKRIVITPCCKYEQATQQVKGTIIFCTKCHNPFVEKK